MLTFLLCYVIIVHVLGILVDAVGDAAIGVRWIAMCIHMVPVVLGSILLYNM